MAEVSVINDREGQTLTVWSVNPFDEFVCEKTGRNVVLVKDPSGRVIGVETLHFSVLRLDAVLLETTDS
ncbi:MAG: DUF2283 domain-containing protein [Acidobacteria bacterium]|nr:DUF2283 domain-containing protein [Acidobacteriota bacterium]